MFALKKSFVVYFFAVIAVVLINYVTQLLVSFLGLPLFLDTWGTSFAVLVVGLWAGMFGGVLYNLSMVFLQGWSWVWMFSSIWVAFTTWFLYKNGLLNIRRPGSVLFSALFLGFTNALVSFEITLLMFGGLPSYVPTNVIHVFFYNLTGSLEVSAFLQHLVVELVDKTVAVFIATWLAFIFPVKCISKGQIRIASRPKSSLTIAKKK